MQQQKYWIPRKAAEEKLLVAVLAGMIQHVLAQDAGESEELATTDSIQEAVPETRLQQKGADNADDMDLNIDDKPIDQVKETEQDSCATSTV